jgi:hypothetical protein
MQALVFVYNADSGLFNTLTDIAHKIFSPSTYSCNLCALTHTAFGMKSQWKAFLATLPMPLEFLHANELRRRHGNTDTQLPAIFQREGDRLALWLPGEAINRCRTLEELQSLITAKVSRPQI